MRNRSKLALAGLAAAIAFGAVLGTASARRLALSSQTFRATWSALRIKNELGTEIACPMTLEGSFHSRTFSKVLEALIGYVTRALIVEATCTGGKASASLSLPWSIRYNGFAGVLPSITQFRFRLIDAAFLMEEARNCLIRTRTEIPLKGWFNLAANGEISLMGMDESEPIPWFIQLEGLMGCGERPFSQYRITGNSNAPTVLGTTTRITVSLVA